MPYYELEHIWGNHLKDVVALPLDYADFLQDKGVYSLYFESFQRNLSLEEAKEALELVPDGNTLGEILFADIPMHVTDDYISNNIVLLFMHLV